MTHFSEQEYLVGGPDVELSRVIHRGKKALLHDITIPEIEAQALKLEKTFT